MPYHWYLSTGMFVVYAVIALAVCQMFMRGWNKSRAERKQRAELMTRLAADMRQVLLRSSAAEDSDYIDTPHGSC